MIRVAEMRESLKIVRQAMDKITDDGAIKTERRESCRRSAKR